MEFRIGPDEQGKTVKLTVRDGENVVIWSARLTGNAYTIHYPLTRWEALTLATVLEAMAETLED